jgi:uncharacterized protein YmfQ (DUF2313 family)
MRVVTRLLVARAQRRRMEEVRAAIRAHDVGIAERIEAGAALFMADPRPDGPEHLIARWERRRAGVPRALAFAQRLRDGEASVATASIIREAEWAESQRERKRGELHLRAHRRHHGS